MKVEKIGSGGGGGERQKGKRQREFEIFGKKHCCRSLSKLLINNKL